MRPVLRFGAAGTGLDIEKAVVRIHRIRKHAAELEIDHGLFEVEGVIGDRLQRGVVVFLAGHRKEFVGVLQVLIEFCQGADGGFERLALAAEVLRAFGIAPDGGVFAELYDFFEAFALRFEVKDTSAVRRCAGRGPAGDGRRD